MTLVFFLVYLRFKKSISESSRQTINYSSRKNQKKVCDLFFFFADLRFQGSVSSVHIRFIFRKLGGVIYIESQKSTQLILNMYELHIT